MKRSFPGLIGLLAIILPLAACASSGLSGGNASSAAQLGTPLSVATAPLASPALSAGPMSSVASTTSPVRIGFSLPVVSPKRYSAILTFDSGPPTVQLGDPGMVTVSSLNVTSASFTDNTEGGRPILMGTDPTFAVHAAWQLTPALAAQIDLSSTECGKAGTCDTSELYLVSSSILKGDQGMYSLVHLQGGVPLVLTPASMFTTAASTTDVNGKSVSGAQFPESATPSLNQLLAEQPAVTYVDIPSTEGTFGFADGIANLPCLATSTPNATYFVLGVIDVATGSPLTWDAVHSVGGQPCHGPEAQAPPPS